MMDAAYYREQAARAHRLADGLANHEEIARQLSVMAQDYDDIAVDLENGAIEIRHPELMPQNARR